MHETATMVRMGEQAASASPDERLVTIGLGSCIGLALVDGARGVAGLAHVMLPESGDRPRADQLGRFADTAVPALVERLVALGARRTRLRAVLVGGAQMFSFGGGSLDIGARNEACVRDALERLRIPVEAAATGGDKGRTVSVHVRTGVVASKEAGGIEQELFSPCAGRR
jgi:chemotaxis protein CheD